MRIWDVSPRCLCRQHLLGEHRELHGLWNILTKHKARGGYSQHPETKRWLGREKALFLRHEALVKEMARRGYKHRTPLEKRHAKGKARQDRFVHSVREQHAILLKKPCPCPLERRR